MEYMANAGRRHGVEPAGRNTGFQVAPAGRRPSRAPCTTLPRPPAGGRRASTSISVIYSNGGGGGGGRAARVPAAAGAAVLSVVLAGPECRWPSQSCARSYVLAAARLPSVRGGGQ